MKPVFLAMLVCLALLAACRQAPRDTIPGEPPLPEPVVPAGYKKTAPLPADTSPQMLAQTASIFRGTLKDVRFTYDDCGGPRTAYVFSDASSLAGSPVPREFTVKMLGGPTPKGAWIEASEIPKLALDAEYVGFLRNTDWTFSPVVNNLVFRREVVAGREVLIDPSGHAVTGWGENGPLISDEPVSAPVGLHIRGMRRPTPNGQDGPFAPGGTPGVVRPGTGRAPAPAPAPADQVLVNAPPLEEIRRVGLFARPEVPASALANVQAIPTETFVSTVIGAARTAGVEVGGRLTLEPYWRCWSTTRTSKAAR